MIEEYFAPKQEEKPTPTTLFQYIEVFLENAASQKDAKTGRYIDRSTLVKYQATYKLLQQFAIYEQKIDFGFDELTIDFYNRYVDFLERLEYTTNTVGRFVKELKSILTQATKDGINTSLQYKYFKVLTEEIDNVYLNEQELECIKNAALDESPNTIEKLLREQSKKIWSRI
ncbi:phage integrase SAM-like domain-containing protein [Alistipes communis]|uniref:phage integrase SAM-like domain-containing protein n=1 Tax=Alistipes communis TaxID=2585118 RepID=UPI00031C054E|nr:phage integrase SAM-like domain-containing protein [Alistipes communis]